MQVNGKVRDRIQVSADASEDAVREKALALAAVQVHRWQANRQGHLCTKSVDQHCCKMRLLFFMALLPVLGRKVFCSV
jgi:leucyl-tRNA synthetase